LDEIGWYRENTKDKATCTQPSGTKKPNSFGLYDMAGNVSEWVEDWFDGMLDPYDEVTNRPKPFRLLKGGNCSSYATSELRASSATYREPSTKNKSNEANSISGFRCILTMD
jgi:formylglycine-generating enzyme required for sulfatase activity